MKYKRLSDLPEEHTCRACGHEKPLAEMVVIHERKTGHYLLRGCKDCNNKRERGHRREWKRNYLRQWRKKNPQLNESYWRQSSILNRSKINAQARQRVNENHHALLIQGRMRRRGQPISLSQAKTLLREYGPCYPTRFGLTPEGLKECERIRSGLRRINAPVDTFAIRVMVYEDGYFIKPSRQKIPFRVAADRLRNWHRQRKAA